MAKVNQEQYVDTMQAVLALMDKIEQNDVLLGVTILSKREGEPSPKKDSSGNFTGEYYPVPLYAELAFKGGQITQRLPSREIFDRLKEGKRYTMKGRVEVFNSTAVSQQGNDYVRSTMTIRIIDFFDIHETFKSEEA